MGVGVDGLRPLWWFCELGWAEGRDGKASSKYMSLQLRGSNQPKFTHHMTCIEDSHPIVTAPFVQNAGILRRRV